MPSDLNAPSASEWFINKCSVYLHMRPIAKGSRNYLRVVLSYSLNVYTRYNVYGVNRQSLWVSNLKMSLHWKALRIKRKLYRLTIQRWGPFRPHLQKRRAGWSVCCGGDDSWCRSPSWSRPSPWRAWSGWTWRQTRGRSWSLCRGTNVNSVTLIWNLFLCLYIQKRNYFRDVVGALTELFKAYELSLCFWLNFVANIIKQLGPWNKTLCRCALITNFIKECPQIEPYFTTVNTWATGHIFSAKGFVIPLEGFMHKNYKMVFTLF